MNPFDEDPLADYNPAPLPADVAVEEMPPLPDTTPEAPALPRNLNRKNPQAAKLDEILTDVDAEATLLGALLNDPTGAYREAADEFPLEVDSFTNADLGRVYGAVCALRADGQAVSVTSVADSFSDKVLSRMGGIDRLLKLPLPADAADVQATAQRLHALDVRRLTVQDARNVALAAANGQPIADLAAKLATRAAKAEQGKTTLRSKARDLAGTLALALTGELPKTLPSLLAVGTVTHLLYRGKTHWWAAPPEAGKTWLALYAALEALSAGMNVIWLDYEEDDERSGVERLVSLARGRNYSDEHITALFAGLTYYCLAEKIGPAEKAELLDQIVEDETALVIVDGVANALAAHGLDEDRAGDVNSWVIGVLRPMAAAHAEDVDGPAVLVIDHVSKGNAGVSNAFGQSNFQARSARGSGAKLAQVSGNAVSFDVVSPFNKTSKGEVKLYITKDRPGGVVTKTDGGKERHVATMHVDPQNNGEKVVLNLIHADDEKAARMADPRGDKTINMENVSKSLEVLNAAGKHPSVTDLKAYIRSNGQTIKDAAVKPVLDQLERDGFITRRVGTGKGNPVELTSVRAFRKKDYEAGAYGRDCCPPDTEGLTAAPIVPNNFGGFGGGRNVVSPDIF